MKETSLTTAEEALVYTYENKYLGKILTTGLLSKTEGITPTLASVAPGGTDTTCIY